MSTGIRTDASGLYGALQVGAADVMRFGSDNSGQLAGFRNRIINGDFQVAQRGISITNATPSYAYGIDRWRFYGQAGLVGSATMSQQFFTVGQTDVPNEPKFYLRWDQTVAASGTVAITQPIEDVRTFAGQSCVLSFWAKSSSARAIAVRLTQNFGSGGSGDVMASQSISLTTSWQQFKLTYTLGSISGKTLGSGNYLDVVFLDSNSNTFTTEITEVQLELGSIATPFEHRPIGLELSLCQRYYRNDFFAAPGSFYSTTNVNIRMILDPPMRVTPTVSLSSGTSVNIDIVGVQASSIASPSLTAQSNHFINVSGTMANNASIGSPVALTSSTIQASAEL